MHRHNYGFRDVLFDPVHEILDFSHVGAAKSSQSVHFSRTQSTNIDEGSKHT